MVVEEGRQSMWDCMSVMEVSECDGNNNGSTSYILQVEKIISTK